MTENELHLLRFGRHFRLREETKLIVGRTDADNDGILKHRDIRRDTTLKVNGYTGPIALIPAGRHKEVLPLAASICAGYSKAPKFAPVKVDISGPIENTTVTVLGLLPSDVKQFLI